MRNASKNTIKRVMRKALFDQTHKDSFFFIFGWNISKFSPEKFRAYFLYNNIGAQIFRMSKGKICNRGLIGIKKYEIYRCH